MNKYQSPKDLNMEINQFYSTGVRFISTASITPNLDAKLIAFYTILTVALSIMLSFRQSRCMLINNYTTYPLIKVKKCLKCLKRTKKQECKVIINNCANNAGNNNNNVNETNCNNKNNSFDSNINNQIENDSNLSSSEQIANYSSYFNSTASYYTSYLKLKSLKRLTLATLSTGSHLLKKMNYYRTRTSGSNRRSISRRLPDLEDTCKHRKINLADRISIEQAKYCAESYCETCQSLKYSNGAFSTTMPVFPTSVNTSGASAFHRSHSVPSGLNTKPKKYNTKISLYKRLPLKSLSRAWGGINSIDLPVVCRKPCFYLYGWLFSCNFDEIDIADLNEFKNLSEFFRRTLKPDARVIDTECCLANPCDGRILNFGKVDKGMLEQVKGVNYSLKGFLGPQDWPTTKKNTKIEFTLDEGLPPNQLMDNDQFYEKNVLYNPEENCLYHCVIYLAPGDYHRFHSPTDWNIHYRRHFPGELFSVNPSVARWLEGLFNFNERVVYYGDWKYGFFSYTAVGATNVGSIKVFMDEDLTTNNKKLQKEGKHLDKDFLAGTEHGVPVKRGEDFGEFNLGSTIVMIFEAPKNFEFETMPGEKVFLGSQLGSSTRSTYM